MAGPVNAVMGDDNYGTDLPTTEVPEEFFIDLQHKARFSKSAEFKELKETVESRIKYYERFFPSARGEDIAIRDMPNQERGYRWLAADIITQELQNLIMIYESAAQEIKDETARRKAAQRI